MTTKALKCNVERPELVQARKKYNIISDSLEGELAVKDKGVTYLPMPSSCDSQTEKLERYASYKMRAVYYNVIKPTQDALVGQLFLREPKVKVPKSMEMMLEDINGEGLSFEQLVRKAANHILPYGRGGLLADFPVTDGEVTKADVESGIRPTIRFIPPWAIINWQITKIKTEHKLVMLVLKEAYEYTSGYDSFKVQTSHKYRVYRLLEDGCVSVEVWDEESGDLKEAYNLCGQDGKNLGEIPFEFVGSENNDSEIDEPPLYSMAVLNIAHYRNSADYEESVFLVGQPTPVYAGLTDDWVTNHFQKGIPFGSRAAVPLPEDATAHLLQAMPNTLAFEAMTHKEEQMIAIGAKIINPRQTVERKEAEIQIEAASQKSVLSTIKDNLEAALLSCLKKAALFVDTTGDEEIEVELNDNFDLTSMSAEELRWLIELFGARLMPFSGVHENLRRSGLVKNSVEDAMAAIKADQSFIDSINPDLEPASAKDQPNSKAEDLTN
jgi:hypothetical protein